MAALSTQHVVDAGTAPTFSAASTSDTAEIGNGGNTFAVYKNGDTSAHTLTVTAPGQTTYGEDLPDPQHTISDGGEVWVPLRKAYDDGTGSATLSLDAATSVTVAIVRLG